MMREKWALLPIEFAQWYGPAEIDLPGDGSYSQKMDPAVTGVSHRRVPAEDAAQLMNLGSSRADEFCRACAEECLHMTAV